MATKPAKQLTLHDHLSRLNLKRAEKLLGADAKRLLGEGRRYEINIPQQVKVGRKRMRVRFPRAIDGKRTAVVTLDLSDHKRKRLQISCTPCEQDGELQGAVLELILNNKLDLGLSIPPGEEPPFESLEPEALAAYALAQREKRAKEERTRIESQDPETPWADYTIYNHQSGKTYRAALRSFEPGDAYCSCQDFKTNQLGTCKHLIKLKAHVKRKFSAEARAQPHVQREFAVALDYGETIRPRLLRPEKPKLFTKTRAASKCSSAPSLTPTSTKPNAPRPKLPCRPAVRNSPPAADKCSRPPSPFWKTSSPRRIGAPHPPTHPPRRRQPAKPRRQLRQIRCSGAAKRGKDAHSIIIKWSSLHKY